MSAVLDIGRNTFGTIIRNKVLYLALFLLILIVGLAIFPIAMIGVAAQGDEPELARTMQVSLIVGIFGLWNLATQAMAIFLGATAISSEVRARTIVTVLSKPVDRWRFLLGKWCGTQLVLTLFMAIGMLLSSAILFGFEVYPSGLFWLGVVRSFVLVIILSSLAMLISTVTSAVFAGGITLLLAMLSGPIVGAVDAPFLWLRLPARGFFFLAPASPPGNLLQQGFNLDLLDPPYGLYVGVLTENVLYGFILLVISCMIFTRREVPLR